MFDRFFFGTVILAKPESPYFVRSATHYALSEKASNKILDLSQIGSAGVNQR
jgi:hypothetical protein